MNILKKSHTNATNATLHLLGQTVWEHIWKLTVEKKRTNATTATLHLFGQIIWGDSWKKRTSATICDFPSIQAGDFRKHLKTPLGEKAYKCNQCDFASVRADNLRRHLKKHTNATNATLHLYRQAIWGHIWKLTLEKSIQMQSMRLCICSGRQFEETVEKTYKCNHL